MFINYLSASSDYLLVTPSEIAKNVNKEVFKFKGRLGIILCDFPGENLISYLIDQNLNIEKLLTNNNLFITNGNCLSFKHLCTGKYLSINNENNLICSKDPYYFILSKKNAKGEEEMIAINDEITLIGNVDFDFIIINSPLPDDTGLRFAIDTVSSYQTVVLFLARTEQYAQSFDQLAEHGVFLIQKPVSKAAFELASGWLISARERIRKTEKKTLSIEEKMNEIRLVNRAKWLLISELKMDEPQAHRYIEKQAMDRRLEKVELAKKIIETFED